MVTIKELKKQADIALRQYLLKTTPKKNGKYYCPLKKKYYPPHKMQVAHFIDRGVYHLRHDLRNCHLISEDSNVWDAKVVVEGYKSLHHKDYEEYLGKEMVEQLKKESTEYKVLQIEDYEEIIKKLTESEQ